MDSNNPTLWYFADPMCSWCWGFSPVITQVKENYLDKLNIALVMGGLQTEDVGVMSEDSQKEIFHHWHQVVEMTKQPISFDNAFPENFIYNTEPACRAVITPSPRSGTSRNRTMRHSPCPDPKRGFPTTPPSSPTSIASRNGRRR